MYYFLKTIQFVCFFSLFLSNQVFAGKQLDPYEEEAYRWLQDALYHQRILDLDTPMAENNLIGTHNSYNSTVYRDLDSYIDPQQKLSVYEQLKEGARFIELDVHWNQPFFSAGGLVLCHGSDREIFGLHLGCGFSDTPLAESLIEIQQWLEETANDQEVLIFYIEDHTEQHHDELMALLDEYFGDIFYPSGGCVPIPDDLTKAQVLAAKKRLVFWKDRGCAHNSKLLSIAFSDLGSLKRFAEDRTILGTIAHQIASGSPKRIGSIYQSFIQDGNIVNLDNLERNDKRLYEAVWSWEKYFPTQEAENACALSLESGRWENQFCDQKKYFACVNKASGFWSISAVADNWHQGQRHCASLADSHTFSVPTNAMQNEMLREQMNLKGINKVWLNYFREPGKRIWNPNFLE